MTRREIRSLIRAVGFHHAEYCLQQAESQGACRAARAEYNLLWSKSALFF